VSYAQLPEFTVTEQSTFKAGKPANITWRVENPQLQGEVTIGVFLYRYGKSDVPVGTFEKQNYTAGYLQYLIPNDTAYGCSYFACLEPRGAAGIFVCARKSLYFCVEGGPAASIPQDYPLAIVGTFSATMILPGMYLDSDGGKFTQICNSKCANVQALGSLNIGNGTAQLSIKGFENGICNYPNMTVVITLLSPFTVQPPPSQNSQATIQAFIFLSDSKISSAATTGCMTYSTPSISYATKSLTYNFHIDTQRSSCMMGTHECGAGWFTVEGVASLDYTRVLDYLAQLASNVSGQTIFVGIAIAVGVIIATIAVVLFLLYCIATSNKAVASWLSDSAGIEFDEIPDD
jgi:hypothetical protein